MTFVEATVLYQVTGTDPRDPGGHRSEKRLFNLDAVRLVEPAGGGKGHSVFLMRDGSPPMFVVLEPYEYWVAILSAEQPRRAFA